MTLCHKQIFSLMESFRKLVCQPAPMVYSVCEELEQITFPPETVRLGVAAFDKKPQIRTDSTVW